MDRMIYLAMSGAKAAMEQQTAVANNLANASTTGFKTELHRFRAVQVESAALPTRAFAVDATVRNDLSQGPMLHTGNTFDVAVQGSGWLAVQTPSGEAYTRAGNLMVDANGVLRTVRGLEVVGDGGPIAIPPDNQIEIAADGTISATPLSGSRNASTQVGRLKLVNPPEDTLERGDDGLFRVRGGAPAPQDETVKVAGGYLEGSNVNVVEQMVSMISVARQFEMHTKVLQNAQENDRASTKLVAAT